MISTLQADYTPQGKASVAPSVQQSTAAPAATEAGASSSTAANTEIVLQHATDLVEISPHGKAMARATKAPPAAAPSSAAAARTAATSTQSALSTASTQSTVAEASTESDTAGCANLTGLSEQEIDKLVQQGTVTQSQADTELARRATRHSEPVTA